MAHVAEWKYKEIKELTDVIQNKKVIALVNIGGIPGPQLQRMRKNFHGEAVIRCSKNSLIKIALK